MEYGAIIKFTLASLITGAGIVVVTLWSLASPASDPVGQAVGWMAAKQTELRHWYQKGPVDAKPDWSAMQFDVLHGDAENGRTLLTQFGCGACHVIPGVAGARGTVGPSLEGLADRAYIAGVLTNRPGDLTRWLINPPLFSPQTAMPDLGVTEADATDMVAYLYTLGRD